ncbi:hypothetical protein ACKKBG_A21930 [Auxenochlorella protothecoides x Auxenochlorella symbiontica]
MHRPAPVSPGKDWVPGAPALAAHLWQQASPPLGPPWSPSLNSQYADEASTAAPGMDYNHNSLKDHPGPRSQPHATLLACPSCVRVHPGAPSRRPDVKFMHRGPGSGLEIASHSRTVTPTTPPPCIISCLETKCRLYYTTT